MVRKYTHNLLGVVAWALFFCVIGQLLGGNSKVFALSGDGSVSAPFVITTCNELQDIATNLTANYALGNDIDCSGSGSWNGGQGFTPIGLDATHPFMGTLDGQGYSISNLAESSHPEFNGLFGTTNGATIKNLHLV